MYTHTNNTPIFSFPFRSFLFAVLLSFSVLLCSCEQAPKTQPEDVRIAFLTAYFTTDYEGRYSNYLQETDTEKVSEKSSERYYACIEDYVTEKMYTGMINGRALLSLDRLAAEKGVVITPVLFEFEEYSVKELTTYTFVVGAEITGSYEGTGEIEGQIMMQDEDTVAHVHISNQTIFPDL